MNAVSDKFVQLAMDCSCSSAIWSSVVLMQLITATGLPLNGLLVKTSTCLKGKVNGILFVVLRAVLEAVSWISSTLLQILYLYSDLVFFMRQRH